MPGVGYGEKGFREGGMERRGCQEGFREGRMESRGPGKYAGREGCIQRVRDGGSMNANRERWREGWIHGVRGGEG